MQIRLRLPLVLLVLSQTLGCTALVRPTASELSLHQKLCPPASGKSPHAVALAVAEQPRILPPVESRQNLLASNSSDPGPLPPVLTPAEARRQRDLRFAEAQKQAQERIISQAAVAPASATAVAAKSTSSDFERSPHCMDATPNPAPQPTSSSGPTAYQQSNYLSAKPRSTHSPLLFVTITALVLSGVTWPLAVRQRRNHLRAIQPADCLIPLKIDAVPPIATTSECNPFALRSLDVQNSHWSSSMPAYAASDSSSVCIVLWDAEACKPWTVPSDSSIVPFDSPAEDSNGSSSTEKLTDDRMKLSDTSEHLSDPEQATRTIIVRSHRPSCPPQPGKLAFSAPALIRLQSPSATAGKCSRCEVALLDGRAPSIGGLIPQRSKDTLTVSNNNLKPEVYFCGELVKPTPGGGLARTSGSTPARYVGSTPTRYVGSTPARASYVGFVVLLGNDRENETERQILGIKSYEVGQDQSLVARVVRVV